jgi:hypothetical protein
MVEVQIFSGPPEGGRFKEQKGGSDGSRPFFVEFGIQLAMSTAAVTSTAVVSATTAAVKAIAAAGSTTRIGAVGSTVAAVTASDKAAGVAAPVAVVRLSVIATMSVVPASPVITATPVVPAAAIIAAVEPGAGTDEDATGEVIRAVIAVWSAGVRIVAVITVGACGR